jgi:hypothetical protein
MSIITAVTSMGSHPPSPLLYHHHHHHHQQQQLLKFISGNLLDIISHISVSVPCQLSERHDHNTQNRIVTT